MVGYGDELNNFVFDPKYQIKRKPRKYDSTCFCNNNWPSLRHPGRKTHHTNQLLNESVCSNVTAFGVPRERLINLFLRCWMDNYLTIHSKR